MQPNNSISFLSRRPLKLKIKAVYRKQVTKVTSFENFTSIDLEKRTCGENSKGNIEVTLRLHVTFEKSNPRLHRLSLTLPFVTSCYLGEVTLQTPQNKNLESSKMRMLPLLPDSRGALKIDEY